MATITIENGTLSVLFSPADKFWSIHGSFHIPLEHVTGARAVTENGWHYFWKIAGTSLPGVKVAGTFLTGDGMAFCDFGTGANCIDIEIRHEFYKKLVVELDVGQDPSAVVAEILAAIVR
ncbi:MAG TPA: hypothetical protein VIJ12_09350 [Candidatus Baltobacteraceae bacterium]